MTSINTQTSLRLSAELASRISLEPDYIKAGSGETASRRIFRNQPFDSFEKSGLDKFKQVLIENKVVYNKQSQDDPVLLRFLYANQFQYTKALHQFLNHLYWLSQPSVLKLSAEARGLLTRKDIYVMGRDKYYRPTIVINVPKLQQQLPQDINNALQYQLVQVEEQMFYPGKVESWIVILNFEEQTPVQYQPDQIKDIIDGLQTNFPCCLDEMFILNPPHKLQVQWSLIQNMISPMTVEKIQMLKGDQIKALAQLFDPSQLDTRFGGAKEDLSPPKQLQPQSLNQSLNQLESPMYAQGQRYSSPTLQDKKLCRNCNGQGFEQQSPQDFDQDLQQSPYQPKYIDPSEMQNMQGYQEPEAIVYPPGYVDPLSLLDFSKCANCDLCKRRDEELRRLKDQKIARQLLGQDSTTRSNKNNYNNNSNNSNNNNNGYGFDTYRLSTGQFGGGTPQGSYYAPQMAYQQQGYNYYNNPYMGGMATYGGMPMGNMPMGGVPMGGIPMNNGMQVPMSVAWNFPSQASMNPPSANMAAPMYQSQAFAQTIKDDYDPTFEALLRKPLLNLAQSDSISPASQH